MNLNMTNRVESLQTQIANQAAVFQQELSFLRSELVSKF